MTNNMGSELLTIADLARILDLPESTTRYYCNRFADHLPSVGEGRRRRFKPEASDVLRTIAETMRRDKNAFAVDLALRNSGDVVPAQSALPFYDPTPAFTNQIFSLMENQTKALQDIASAMMVFADRLAVPATAQTISAVQTAPVQEATPSPAPPAGKEDEAQDSPALRQEIISLRKQVAASEAVHQNDLEQLRKWLTRLGEALTSK